MEIDLEHVQDDLAASSPALQAEVCVVGGGIAGLTLAHSLAVHGTDVLLVEAGGTQEGAASEAAAVFPEEIHAGTAHDRVRALGGTSLTWGGQLLPVLDFEGWPVSAEQLAPYWTQVERLFGVDDASFEAEAFFASQRFSAPGLSGWLPSLVPRMSKFAPFGSRNLGASLGRELLAHPRGRVLLQAEVTEIQLSLDGRRVAAVLVRSRSGKQVSVSARHFVLAAGTVETCRLLLASRSVMAEGVGNAHDQVGRNFHDHLTVTAAVLEGAARREVLRQCRPWILGGLRGTVHSLKLETPPGRDRGGSVDGMAHFVFEEPEGTGVGVVRELLRSRQKGSTSPAWLRPGQLPRALVDFAQLYLSATRDRRRFVSRQASVALRLNVAQRTPSASRVCLAPECDGLGRPLAEVRWRVGSEEIEELRRFARHLRDCLAPHGFGAGEGALWNESVLASEGEISGLDEARHAMGGACFGMDARSSVVDPELKVHGVDNLHVASAAVLPDGRAQLPTMTLMALSLRLADRLRAQLAKDGAA